MNNYYSLKKVNTKGTYARCNQMQLEKQRMLFVPSEIIYFRSWLG